MFRFVSTVEMDGLATVITTAAPSTLTSIARLERRGETNCDGVGTCELSPCKVFGSKES